MCIQNPQKRRRVVHQLTRIADGNLSHVMPSFTATQSLGRAPSRSQTKGRKRNAGLSFEDKGGRRGK